MENIVKLPVTDEIDILSTEEEIVATWKFQGESLKTRPVGNVVLVDDYDPAEHGPILYRKTNTTPNLWEHCVML